MGAGLIVIPSGVPPTHLKKDVTKVNNDSLELIIGKVVWESLLVFLRDGWCYLLLWNL